MPLIQETLIHKRALVYQSLSLNPTIQWVVIVVQSLSRVRLFVTPWTVALQAPLSTGFSRQEYWSGLPFTPLGVLPDSGIKSTYPTAPAVQANSLPPSHWGSPPAPDMLLLFSR